MTPERIAAIREQHTPKPHLDYTDCALCFEEYPCELIAALDMLATARAERDSQQRVAIRAMEDRNDLAPDSPLLSRIVMLRCW